MILNEGMFMIAGAQDISLIKHWVPEETISILFAFEYVAEVEKRKLSIFAVSSAATIVAEAVVTAVPCPKEVIPVKSKEINRRFRNNKNIAQLLR